MHVCLPFFVRTSDVPGKDRPLGNLINAMCQANEVQRLFSFSFIGYEDVLENELVFKARNSDPLAFPNYHQVLYAYYMQKKKFRDGEPIATPPTDPSDSTASPQRDEPCISKASVCATTPTCRQTTFSRWPPSRHNATLLPFPHSPKSNRKMHGQRFRRPAGTRSACM